MSNHKSKSQAILERAAKYSEAGLFHKSIPLYSQLVNKFPDQLELKIQLAHSMGLSGLKDDALYVYSQIEKDFGRMPELLIRSARDREQWQDIEGALDTYDRLFSTESKWHPDAVFHQVRLNERLNRIDAAENAMNEAKKLGYVDKAWGWSFVQGHLAKRRNNYSLSRSLYEQSEAAAPAEKKAQVTSALARLADKQNDFREAHKYIQLSRDHRASSAQEFRRHHPIIDYNTDIPSLTQDAAGPIFLAGLPRSGTSLLSRTLEKNYHICQSEEYNFATQLVNRFMTPGGKLLPPGKIASRPKSDLKTALSAYYQSQRQSVKYEHGSSEVLLDKNPSLTPLLPWLLALIPGLRILWIDRPMSDVWLSSVMQDVPLNPATCWWQDPQHYESWAQPILALGNHLERELSRERFHRVNYESLVTDSGKVIEDIAKLFHLDKRNEIKVDLSPARSPTYAEVDQKITDNRLNRWPHYRDFFHHADQKALDSWT